jgi:hypothetical protein
VFRWPEAAKFVLDAQQRTADVGTTFLSVDCALGDDPAIPPFYVKALLFFLLPIFIVLLATAVFGLFYRIKSTRVPDRQQLWQRSKVRSVACVCWIRVLSWDVVAGSLFDDGHRLPLPGASPNHPTGASCVHCCNTISVLFI